MTRQHAPEIYNSVKTAVKMLVAELGGVEAAGACTRVGKSQISEYGSVHSERFVPVDIVLDMERIAGSPHVTEALARAQGFGLVPVHPRPGHDINVELARIGQRVAHLFATAAAALADNQLTTEELLELSRDLDAVARVTAEARAGIHHRLGATIPSGDAA